MKSNTILREWPKRDCSDYTQQYLDSGLIEDNRTIKEISEKFLEVWQYRCLNKFYHFKFFLRGLKGLKLFSVFIHSKNRYVNFPQQFLP